MRVFLGQERNGTEKSPSIEISNVILCEWKKFCAVSFKWKLEQFQIFLFFSRKKAGQPELLISRYTNTRIQNKQNKLRKLAYTVFRVLLYIFSLFIVTKIVKYLKIRVKKHLANANQLPSTQYK